MMTDASSSDPHRETERPDADTNASGGVKLNADHINIGGDVVGRDKIVFTGDQQYDVHGLANPYLGLQSFTYAEHAKYAGPEKRIVETIARLTAPDNPLALLFVTGASGSGKSSFVQAGVLPALEKHYAALNVKWAIFRPLRDPLAGLADALWRQLGLPQFDAHMALSDDFGNFLSSNTPLQQVNVIVIDQFEELFTQSSAQPRDALFNLLAHLPPFRLTRTHIIATLRVDYLPELFALPELYDIAKHGIDLHAMSVDELRDAIQQPLRAAYAYPDKDKRFQAELVERLAQDAAEDPAYLPLLQVTLQEIWRKGTLTVGSYTNLADAIRQRADKVMEYQDYDAAQPGQLRSPEEQAAILNLCLNLVDVSLDDEARRDVRRRRSKDELVSGAPDQARLIDTLTKARLLSVDTESNGKSRVEVDLIHETLLSNWDRLRQAIAEQRHELRQRAHFEQQLKEWLGHNRSADYLLSGIYLAEARELERRGDIALRSADAEDFVSRSVEREEVEHRQELENAQRMAAAQRRAATLLRWVAFVLALGIIGSLIGGVIAIQQRNEAQRQAHIALSRQLAAQALSHLDDHFDLALLLNVEAHRVADTVEARSGLLSAVQHSPRLETFLRGHTDVVRSVAFSPDGKTLASGSDDGTIRLWDVSNPKARVPLGLPLTGHTDIVRSVAFSPDGKTLASGSADRTIRLWDVSNPTAPVRLGTPITTHTAVVSVAFGPDGKTLASGGLDKTIILWDVSNPHVPKQLANLLTSFTLGVSSVAFSPNGKTLACSGIIDYTILLWDVSNPKAPVQIKTLPASNNPGVVSVAFSSDGKTLASGGNDNTILLWDVSNPQAAVQLGVPLTGHTAGVYSVAFSPDGKMLASGSKDLTIRLWDVSNPKYPFQLGTPLMGHGDIVESVAFSPDGKTLASGSFDTMIILWDMSHPMGTPISTQAFESSVAFSPDSKTLASNGLDNGIILWDVSNPNIPVQIGTPSAGHAAVHSVAFSPDGKMVASDSTDNTIILWDVSNPKVPVQLDTPLTGHTDRVYGIAFSPDGKTLASGSDDKTIILWDVTNPIAPVRLGLSLTGHTDIVRSVAFSPDGKTLASGSNDKTIILWDVSNRLAPVQLGTPINTHAAVSSVVFNPAGKMLATGGDNGIILWDVSNPKALVQLGTPLAGYAAGVSSVTFSPDGKLLAAGGLDGFIVVWDLKTGQRLGAPLTGHTDIVRSVAFSPDGKTLASGSFDKTIILWDVDPASWQSRACQIVGRNLTQAEWQQYMGDEPYRQTCEQWPLEPEATPNPTSTP